MKSVLTVLFAASSIFVFVFTVIGWRAFSEKLPTTMAWAANDVIPVTFCLAVIVLPFYLSSPKELTDWLRKADARKSADRNKEP